MVDSGSLSGIGMNLDTVLWHAVQEETHWVAQLVAHDTHVWHITHDPVSVGPGLNPSVPPLMWTISEVESSSLACTEYFFIFFQVLELDIFSYYLPAFRISAHQLGRWSAMLFYILYCGEVSDIGVFIGLNYYLELAGIREEILQE